MSFSLFFTVSMSACGKSSSENHTYISQTDVTTLTMPCSYEICPINMDICRIRFDFTVRFMSLSIDSLHL